MKYQLPSNHYRKASVRYPFKFVEKNHNKESSEEKFQKTIETAIDGTEYTVKTDTGNMIHRNFISRLLFQTEKRNRKETAITSGEITPTNRHCLRGLDRKYGRRDEILCDILNGKLKIVHSRTKSESDTEDDYEDEGEETPEGTRELTYDTSEWDSHREPIRTSTEEAVIQIHPDGEVPHDDKRWWEM